MSDRSSKSNPYESVEHVIDGAREINGFLSFRVLLLALVLIIGVGNTTVALVDAYREGYPTSDGYLFIGIATLLPTLVGGAGMLYAISRRFLTYLVWSIGTIVALLPGLIVWSACAVIPTPRVHMGAGQMHVFFLPVIHIGYCFFVYLAVGLLAQVVSKSTVG
jgi:hypothetical protein